MQPQLNNIYVFRVEQIQDSQAKVSEDLHIATDVFNDTLLTVTSTAIDVIGESLRPL